MLISLFDDVRRLLFCFDNELSLFHPEQADLFSVSLRAKQLVCLLGQRSADLSEDYHRLLTAKLGACLRKSVKESELIGSELAELLEELADQILFWQGIAKKLKNQAKQWELPKQPPGRPAIPEEIKQDITETREAARKRRRLTRAAEQAAKQRAELSEQARVLRERAEAIEARLMDRTEVDEQVYPKRVQ